MSGKFRRFTRRFFVFTNVVIVFIFLLACLVPYLNPQKWWFISFLGLAFPFLLFLVVVYLVGWLILLKARLALLSFFALLIGFQSISVFMGFHVSHSFNPVKDSGSIRILSWNVARFIELKQNSNKGSQVRQNMLDLIRNQDADILCLQEFHTSTDPSYYDNITAVKALGYPYFYFSFDADGDRHYYSSGIFSRFPIIDSGLIRYPRPTLPDALIHADILVRGDTIRVYTTHLQSLQFQSSDYRKLENIREGDNQILSNSRTIFSKWKRAVSNRSIQADIIRSVVKDSPHPVLFSGDLNDVPNSYTYSTVRGGMQDAFLKKGFGIGRTFSGISPTLRIDYIFADHNFKVRQFNRNTRKLSDHYMLVSDISLRK